MLQRLKTIFQRPQVFLKIEVLKFWKIHRKISVIFTFSKYTGLLSFSETFFFAKSISFFLEVPNVSNKMMFKAEARFSVKKRCS